MRATKIRRFTALRTVWVNMAASRFLHLPGQPNAVRNAKIAMGLAHPKSREK